MLQRAKSTGIRAGVCWFSLALAGSQTVAAQQPSATPSEPEAPRVTAAPEGAVSVLRLAKFSGVLKDRTGNPRAGPVSLAFALYKDQQGGSPLWLELQNVQLDE